jgi:glycosyltransferase involved in cell wall biosynthesis
MTSILLLTGEYRPFYGGIATYAQGLAEAAQRAGHDVTVFAPAPPPAAADDVAAADRASGFTILRYAHRGGWQMRPALLARTWAIVASRKWDVVHAIDTPHARALALINLVRRVPYIATVHGDELMWCRGVRRRLWRLLGAYRTADRVVCNSAFTQRLLIERGFVPATQPTVTSYCGVSEFWFERDGLNGAEGGDVRARLGIPQDRDIVLTVARLDERKGHRLVLAALGALPQALQRRAVYVVAGPDLAHDYGQALQGLAAASAVPVVFTGALPDRDVRALYGEARVFCMPNEPHPDRVEGFGQAFLEAGAQRVPSVATRLGGIPEAVIDGVTGLLVDPMDVAGLAAALALLLADPALAERLGAAAELRARRMSFDRCMRLTYGFDPPLPEPAIEAPPPPRPRAEPRVTMDENRERPAACS